jgi:hypothetical protein
MGYNPHEHVCEWFDFECHYFYSHCILYFQHFRSFITHYLIRLKPLAWPGSNVQLTYAKLNCLKKGIELGKDENLVFCWSVNAPTLFRNLQKTSLTWQLSFEWAPTTRHPETRWAALWVWALWSFYPYPIPIKNFRPYPTLNTFWVAVKNRWSGWLFPSLISR